MKKFLALAMVAMMIVAMAAPTFAANEVGTITINGVVADTTYEIYELLDLESYNTASGAYSYKVNANWSGFFATSDALAYVSIDDAGYVTWKNGDDAESVAAFARLALAYAEDNGIDPVKSSAVPGDFVTSTDPSTQAVTGVFGDLELGYYLVDSTAGALCGLTTTNPNAFINAKNGLPTIDKQVEEDSTTQWTESNTADIGQTVNFRVTINVQAGAQNYVYHDIMSKGLTFGGVSKIEHVVPGSNLTEEIVLNQDYTVVTGSTSDDCTFEVNFDDAFVADLEANDKIIIYYSAMLNRNAVIAGEGNTNEAWLDFGDEHHTNHDTTITYTYEIDIIKTDSQNTLLDGAKFKIYDAADGGNEVAVVLMDDGVTYRRARADETGVEIVVKDGKVKVVGFDNGTYYLEETEAPDGYNKLTARQKFIISDNNLNATFNNGTYSTGSGVHVVNKTGSMLPETGGLGTVLFIAIGSILVLGAGVLLVTKKRMSKIGE